MKIEELRAAYAGIDRVNPEGEAYKGIIRLLDSMDPAQQKVLANANIKFISSLARNRLLKKVG